MQISISFVTSALVFKDSTENTRSCTFPGKFSCRCTPIHNLPRGFNTYNVSGDRVCSADTKLVTFFSQSTRKSNNPLRFEDGNNWCENHFQPIQKQRNSQFYGTIFHIFDGLSHAQQLVENCPYNPSVYCCRTLFHICMTLHLFRHFQHNCLHHMSSFLFWYHLMIELMLMWVHKNPNWSTDQNLSE